MLYYFILGSNPTLSIAELASVFDNGRLSLIQKNIALLEINKTINPNILHKIGGSIKFGQIVGDCPVAGPNELLSKIISLFKPKSLNSKFYFGFSYYGKNIPNIKPLAMEFKKSLKESTINSRWVISREPTLSSVVVEQNGLTTERGAEIVIIKQDKKLLLGKTLAVQPFKELSFRDYGRPARDDRSGMLPPKLGQIMINLSVAGPDDTILDPFCGSGTILSEAALLDFKNLIGSDLSNKAVRDTKINLEWISSKFQISNFKFQILIADSTKISKQLLPNSIDAIITEPYLGPQRGSLNLSEVLQELGDLYSKSLAEFYKILKSGGRVVMVWPVFFRQQRNVFLDPNLSGFKIINPIPENLKNNIFIKLTNRQTIIYGREQQKVWREIVILNK